MLLRNFCKVIFENMMEITTGTPVYYYYYQPLP